MNNYEKGRDYEDFVEKVYKAILEAEKRNGRIGHISLIRNKKITSKSGTPAEIDIYWEYTVAGITNAVAIECRNYNRNVDIPRVRDFARKISNISGLKGLLVTKKGFSPNAITEAKADKIDLLIIRELTEKDWEGRIKKASIQIVLQPPTRIIRFDPKFNQEWVTENILKKNRPSQENARPDRLILEDRNSEFKHSLFELAENNFFAKKEAGQHTWNRQFTDGWLHTETGAYKLDSVTVEYEIPPAINEQIDIDFERYVIAIMEYLNDNNDKYVVLDSGEKKKY